MEKYGREEMVRDLILSEGYTHVEADRVVSGLMDKVRENILRGNTLTIRGVCQLIPTILAPRQGNYFGKQAEYPEKFKLTLKVSRSLDKAYRSDKRTQGEADLTNLNDAFSLDEIKD